MADAWDGLYGAAPALPGAGRSYNPPNPLTSSFDAGLRSFARQTIPTAGGVAAFPVGAEVGGAAGSLIAPGLGTAIGAGIGGLATSFGAGAGIASAQQWILDKLTDGAYSRSQQQDEAEHPIASFVGGTLPQLAFMRPGAMSWRGALAGAAIGGGVEAGTEYAQTGTVDPIKVATQSAFGGILQHNNRLGDLVQQPGMMLAAGVRRGIGQTAARIGAEVATARGLADIPDADARIAQAAAELQDPNISPETRMSLARARALQSALGDQRTPAEIAAHHVIEGDALTEASRPAGLGDTEHGEALTSALVHGSAGEPIAEPEQPAFSGARAVADRIIQIESGGNPNARAPTSSASGLGQFTDHTWLRLYKQSYGGRGMTDEQILGLKTDPIIGREMTERLVGTNVSLLTRHDLPVTDGNLYLAHFLGPRAAKVLHAEPSTPIAEILPHDAIEANSSILRGKTAGDVVAWADRKMGGDGAIAQPHELDQPELAQADPVQDGVPGFDDGFDRPAPDADPFAELDAPISPEPVRATVDQSAASDDGLGPAGYLSFVPREGEPGISVIDEEGHFASAVFRDEKGIAQGIVHMPTSAEGREITNEVSAYVRPEYRRQGIATKLYDALRNAGHEVDTLSGTGDLTPNGADFVNARRRAAAMEPREAAPRDRASRSSSRTERATEPLDVLSFLAEHGGLRDDEGHDLQGRGRLISGAITGRRRRGGSAGIGLPAFAPRGGFMFRKDGLSIDQAGELLHEAGYFTGERPTTAEVLDMLADSNRNPVFRPEDVSSAWEAKMAERYGDPEAQSVHEQIASLEHDIRMSIEADPKMTVQLDGNGDQVSVARMLEDLDANDTAIAALRSCSA